MIYALIRHVTVLVLLKMKAISRTLPTLFLACVIAFSLVPVFASASVPSGPAIYFAESIFAGGQVIVTGVGFSPSSTITFSCGGDIIQTVPSPIVADSSGGFTVLLMTGKLGDGSCTITATDGANTAQAPLTVNEHDQDKPPRGCYTTGNSADTRCCGSPLSHSVDGACCGVLAHSADSACCPDIGKGLEVPCGPLPP